jgi:hypothetical protein
VTEANKDYITTDETTVLGYLLTINGTTLIVNKSGRYNLSGTGMQVTSLNFPSEIPVEVKINYTAYIEEAEDVSKLVRQVYYTSNVGQVYGGFTPQDSLEKVFNSKYNYENELGYSKLYSINSVAVEADPGTVFYVKDNSDSSYRRYVVGTSGYLKIEDTDYSIEDISFLGVNLRQKPRLEEGQRRETRDDEFELKTGEVYKNIFEIHNPVKNGVYLVTNKDDLVNLNHYIYVSYDFDKNDYFSKLQTGLSSMKVNIGGKEIDVYRVIYYKNNWYHFTKTYGDDLGDGNDVVLPTSALIDYFYEIEKGEY